MGEKKNGDGDGGKKKEESSVAEFKIDMHCEGCANKIRKSVRDIQGVEKVKADWESNKLIVVGKFDPTKLKEKVMDLTKKKIDNKKDKKPDDKPKPKDKEIPVTTATLKVELHCQGCIEKIYKVVSKTKGVEDMSIDDKKNLVIVKGKMNVKSLIESLEERLKRKVGIVEPNKDKEKEKEKEKEGGEKNNGGGGTTEGNKLDYMAVPVTGYGYGYGSGQGQGGYGGGGGEYVISPQIFSDENPNACSVM